MITTTPEHRAETDIPDLIPARMLNEFAYCPRLGYLEWVQGEFVDNLETLEGRFGHRRVDRPSTAPVPDSNGDGDEQAESQECETIHSRSLMASAPNEGLIAKLDLLELQAGIAVPVDYKRGKVPDVPGNAWEPEQVQLCAQGLILRENGYLCEGGILYFIQSRRRVSVPFEEELVDRTRKLVAQMRQTAVSGHIPAPLIDSPKCPRCSLVGICLPDETALLAARSSNQDDTAARPVAKHEVRRLLPARDEALPIYLQEQGTTLGKSGDMLTVKQKRETIKKVKLIDVSQVSIFGNVQVTAQTLRELSSAGIPLCHFSYGGWFHSLTRGMTHKNVELRISQYATAADNTTALKLAKQFISGKIKNSRTLVRRNLKGDCDNVLRDLSNLLAKTQTAENTPSLLGIEGMAAKTYFGAFAELLKGDQRFDLKSRNRRPPRDPVNAMLSFVYALLTKELTVTLHAVGFDPMLGFLHQPRYGRPSLALDMAEEFRSLIADSVVLTLVNNGEVSPSDFISRAGGVALTTAGRRAVIGAFERRMDTLVTHPIFGYRISYRRVLEVQARLLARTLLGEIEEYPSFCTR